MSNGQSYTALAYRLPRSFRNYILHFEGLIENRLQSFAAQLPGAARVLDAGAGESRHAAYFAQQHYVAVDLAVGDPQWNYRKLDCIADLTKLPFAPASFDAIVNIVTLEHLRDPAEALREMARVLRPGARILIAAPHEWEVHQSPHDFFRYTRHGLLHLLETAGFTEIEITPAGGYFRLLSRRLLNGLQFFVGGARWLLFVPAAALLVPPALLLPALDGLDRDKNFTPWILMHRKTLVLIFVTAIAANAAIAKDFSGARALEFTRHATSFGPRPPNSPAIKKLQTYILAQLRLTGCEIVEDRFTAQAPQGAVPMKNILCRFPGKSGRAIVLSGHYDTKTIPEFTGANDAGSSTGFLLEMAGVLAGAPRKDDVYLVFFDGEEAYGEWTDTNSLYGSRHLAEKWAADGTLPKVKALINVDMIGDKDLSLVWNSGSAMSLQKTVWDTAGRLGFGQYFSQTGGVTGDDHVPFLQRGVKALDLIDSTTAPRIGTGTRPQIQWTSSARTAWKWLARCCRKYCPSWKRSPKWTA